MKFTKSLLLCITTLVVISISGCTGKTEELTTEKSKDVILSELRDVTVMINVSEDHASGVIIGADEETITIATVAHLMSGFSQGIVTFSDYKTAFANVVSCNEKEDICILKMNTSDFDAGYAKKIPVAQIDENKVAGLNAQDKVIIVGSAVGVATNATEGTLADKDYYVPDFDLRMLYLYADVVPGMSGAGVYSTDGYLIGLIAGGSDNSEAVCIKLDSVLDEWRNNND